MIKTRYLEWDLDEIYSDGDGGWCAIYFKPYDWITGYGHTPEAALADAQRKIQRTEHGD